MARGLFLRPSLSIELDAAHFEFDDALLHHPAKYEDPVVRVFVHELLHFWQTLSQSFLTGLALAEWRRLVEFERSGLPSGADHPVLEFLEPHPELGFSAWDLSEALCRYWDVHIIGPVKLIEHNERVLEFLRFFPQAKEHLYREVNGERQYSSLAFDLLMRGEDSYAEPYRYALDRWGSNQSVIFFPIAGHFALQSPRPIAVFAEAINRIRRAFQLDRMRNLDIHYVWPAAFDQVRRICAEACADLCGDRGLETGWQLMERVGVGDHPVFRHYLALLESTSDHWGNDPPGGLDYCFALPGNPSCRERLAYAFRPPATIFHDGVWSGRSPLSLTARLFGKLEGVLEEELLAQESREIHDRARKVRQAELRARLSSASGGITIRSRARPLPSEADSQTLEAAGRRGGDRIRLGSAADAVSLGVTLRERGDVDGAARACTEAVDLARDAPSGEPKRHGARAARILGDLFEERGDRATATGHYLEAIEMGRESGTPSGLDDAAQAAVTLGALAGRGGDARAAEDFLRDALRFGAESGTPEGTGSVARAGFNLGFLFTERDSDAAQEAFAGAVRAGKELADPGGWEVAAMAALGLGNVRRDAAAPDAAAAYREAAELGRRCGTPKGAEVAHAAEIELLRLPD